MQAVGGDEAEVDAAVEPPRVRRAEVGDDGGEWDSAFATSSSHRVERIDGDVLGERMQRDDKIWLHLLEEFAEAALAELLGDPKRLPRGARQLPAWSYVGSQYLCGNHEGYSGETVEWLSQHAVPRAITAYEPDVVLLLAGTNDFFWPPPRGSRSPSAVASRMRTLVGNLFAADTRNLTLLLGTVTPINATRCAYYHTARWHPGDCPDDMQSNIAAYNKLLPGIVSEQKLLGRNVELVQMPTDFTASDYWLWGSASSTHRTSTLT